MAVFHFEAAGAPSPAESNARVDQSYPAAAVLFSSINVLGSDVAGVPAVDGGGRCCRFAVTSSWLIDCSVEFRMFPEYHGSRGWVPLIVVFGTLLWKTRSC